MEPSYTLDDPRPIARSAPYTYYLPPAERLAAIEPGDKVQLLFRSTAPAPKYAVERMWVLVQVVSGNSLAGVLESKPFDMPGMAKGERVRFDRHYAIDVVFGDSGKETLIPSGGRRQYWERCFVDRCVLEDGLPVGFIYRETPETLREGERFADSGWRIRGDARGLSVEEIDERQGAYVALGAVLNRDDSWLSLIDEPPGSSFLRNFETGVYERQHE